MADRPGEFLGLEGDLQMVKNIEFVDQNPIGKSSRSNPVTYIKAYDEIRKLFAAQPLSQQMGFTPGFFSFNTEGGRCEECKGEGTVTVEMQFMADLVLECESCHGKRFKSDLLEVKFGGQNIYDVLNMTVNQAIEFFDAQGQAKISKKLKPLQDVGLGYIKLGQSSNTLSGGENQRVKLAYYLGMEKVEPTIFIFDEPTTGLHFHDIKRLLAAFDALILRGHTLVIIEHNMDVIKCADHIIDLGSGKRRARRQRGRVRHTARSSGLPVQLYGPLPERKALKSGLNQPNKINKKPLTHSPCEGLHQPLKSTILYRTMAFTSCNVRPSGTGHLEEISSFCQCESHFASDSLLYSHGFTVYRHHGHDIAVVHTKHGGLAMPDFTYIACRWSASIRLKLKVKRPSATPASAVRNE